MNQKAISIKKYIQNIYDVLNNTKVTNKLAKIIDLDEATSKIINYIIKAKETNNKVILIGNGGSAAIASHAQNDMCKAVGIKSIVFTEQPLLTALSNDDGYENAYQKLIELWADKNDLLFAVSSSGNSENIIKAINAADKKQCNIITFTGFTPENIIRKMGKLNFYINSMQYGHVEMSHSILIHYLTDQAKDILNK